MLPRERTNTAVVYSTIMRHRPERGTQPLQRLAASCAAGSATSVPHADVDGGHARLRQPRPTPSIWSTKAPFP